MCSGKAGITWVERGIIIPWKDSLVSNCTAGNTVSFLSFQELVARELRAAGVDAVDLPAQAA